MLMNRSFNRMSLWLLPLVAAVWIADTTALHAEPAAQLQNTENVHQSAIIFPASCSPQAQAHFLRGVTALHSFWYPVALNKFRQSTRADPNCMMGYWGEAMAHNHPVWGDPQQTRAARQAIEKIKITSKLTSRERSWLNAVKILYGEGEKIARDKAYAAAMKKIYQDYPDDPEAALFYALALMGTARPGNPDNVQIRLRAGEIVSTVYQSNPNHPGAAHYLIHAYDDPEHAHLALDAAQRYAEIAPDAPHALHMPSHIFLQLGKWPEAAASSEKAWAASNQWVAQENLPISERNYHSLRWLMYIYLQQGRHKEAKKLLTTMAASLPRFPQNEPHNLIFGTFTHAAMAAALVVETEQWKAADLFLPQGKIREMEAQPDGNSSLMQAYMAAAEIPAVFARGLAAAAKGSLEAQKSTAKLQAVREQAADAAEPFITELVAAAKAQGLEIGAMAAAADKNFDAAIEMMRQAIILEEAMPPPSGPPLMIKPSHELLGEILLRAGRPKEAVEQFRICLHRHPNRARSLLGAARSAAGSGNKQDAIKFYRQFERQWQPAEGQLPELQEARNYLENNS